jgi:methylated-DNA-[protein]-cysteine S-methyltransferase
VDGRARSEAGATRLGDPDEATARGYASARRSEALPDPKENPMSLTLDMATLDTPIGAVTMLARGDTLVGLEFSDAHDRVARLRAQLDQHLGAFETREHPDPAGAATRLRAYFGGRRDALEDQPVTMSGTEFQVAVWSQLRRIPPGRTISYAELARRVGNPNASRAVGTANGSNPIALFVPCHRVIASDGTLGGYGGGLDRKRRLLELEGAIERSLV